MKRTFVLIALLTVICMVFTSVSAFAADGENPQDETAEAPVPEIIDESGETRTFSGVYSENHIRYEAEHQMLPYFFYSENGQGFIDNVLTYQGEYLEWLVERNLSTREGYAPYFEADEIEVAVQECALSEGDDVAFTVVRVKMPEPTGCPECGYVFLCYDPDFGNRMYFTLEQSIMTPWMLCGWNADGIHQNFGVADAEPDSLMNAVIGLFVNAMVNGGKAA